MVDLDTAMKWSLSQFAKHYAETVTGQADVDGNYISPIFGPSRMILFSARLRFTEQAIEKATLRELKKANAKGDSE